MEDPEAEQEQDQEQEVNPDAEALPSDEQPVEEDEGAAQSVAASGHKEIRVNLGNMRSRQRPPAEPADTPRSMRDVMLAADVPGFAAGTGLDWEGVGKAVGLGGIILHGLCTMAFTSQAVIKHAAGGDATRLKRLKVRFSKPVKPRDELKTQGWVVDEKQDLVIVGFRVVNQNGAEVLTQGVAEIAR